MTQGTLAPRERELVILRIAAQMRSQYELAHHSSLARMVGLTASEVVALSQPLDRHAWGDTDLQLLAFVDELYSLEDVSDQTWRMLEDRFAPAELMELIFLVCFYRTLATFVRAVRIQLDENAGVAPRDR